MCTHGWGKRSVWSGPVGDPYRSVLARAAQGQAEAWANPASPPLTQASPVQPASDTPPVGDGWPKDSLHDAARQVVRGAKDLTPGARQSVRGALDKAEAQPTGRAAQDGALGRATGRSGRALGPGGWGLITSV